MQKVQKAELLMIAKGKRLDAVRWNPFGEAAREKQKAKLREYLRAKILMPKAKP